MSKTIRIVAWMLAILCLLPMTVFGFRASAAAGEEESGNTAKKVVSVVYDNSGSMRDNTDKNGNPVQGSEHRSQYAEYALQMLMALLSPDDTLWITPMTENGDPVTDIDQGFEVILSKEDRDAEIKRIMKEYKDTKLYPNGNSTPPSSVGIAVDRLKEEGLLAAGAEESFASDTEYWLIVLTDGTFNENLQTFQTDEVLKPYINAYSSFQMVYVGLGGTSVDMTNSTLTKNSNFSALHASNSGEFVSAIQQLANRLSGRYTLPQSALSASGNTVKVDLDACGFPLRSISFVAQDCGATLSAVKYGGKTLQASQLSVIEPAEVLGLANGCSAVVNGDPLFEKGTIELEFTAAVDVSKLSVMVEPALYITPTYEAQVDGEWKQVDEQYVCGYMNAGQKIKVGYKAFAEGSDDEVELDKVFTVNDANPLEEKLSLNGQPAAFGQEITLAKGKNELTLAVNVTSARYAMHATANLYIQEDASSYRVEAKLSENIGGSPTKSQSIFTVYVDKMPLGKSGFDEYKWEVIAKTPSGEVLDVTATLGDDGRVTAELDTSGKEYGKYTVTMTVTSPYHVEKSASTEIYNYPQTIVVEPENGGTMTMTQHAYKFNTEGFSFIMKADGEKFVFDNGMTTYKVTFNGVDVTNYCTTDGNRLFYVPSVDHDSSLVEGSAEKTAEVVVTVSVTNKPSITGSGKATLTITPTAYEVLPLGNLVDGDDGIDRFGLTENTYSTYFAVTRDGVYLTEEELTASLERGEIDFSAFMTSFFFLPAGEEVTVTTVNGTPCIRYRVVSDQPGIIRWFTAMFIFSGTKEVTMTYGSAEGMGLVYVQRANFFSYLWRILLICLIIHIILIFALMGKSPRHARGVLVRIPVNVGNNGYANLPQPKQINLTFKQRLVYKRIINPMAAQARYSMGPVKVKVDKEGIDRISVDSANCLRFKANDVARTMKYDTFNSLMTALRLPGQRPKLARNGANTFDITNGDFLALFPYALQNGAGNQALNLLTRNEPEALVSGVFYAIYDGNNRLTSIYVFIARNR